MRFRLPQRIIPLLLAATFFSLSFEPAPFWFLIYFAIPLFAAAIYKLGFKGGFVNGYVFGIVTAILTLYWVSYVTVTGVVLLILVHSLYYALIAGVVASATRRFGSQGLWLLPFVWVAVEYLRTLTEISFPWQNLSYTQASNTVIVQLAEISGDATVSFFIVVVGLILYFGYASVRLPLRSILLFLLAIVLYTGAYFWGAWRFEPLNPDFKVAALQGDIPINEKWRQGRADHNFEIYADLTQKAAADSARFVLWPETAAPMYIMYEPPYLRWIESIAAQNSVDILTGALHLAQSPDGKRRYYNSAFFFTPEGFHPRVYNKRHLVPFGEQMPYANKIGLLASFRDFVKNNWNLDISDFEPGDSLIIFETHSRKFGSLICFEATYPEYVRTMVKTGAEFLTVITNDDWFGKTAGPYQHFAIPVFRAVENRVWILRAANTGICGVYDPFGRVVAKTKLGGRTHLVAAIGPKLEETTYQRYGPSLSHFSLVVAGAAIIVLLLNGGTRD